MHSRTSRGQHSSRPPEQQALNPTSHQPCKGRRENDARVDQGPESYQTPLTAWSTHLRRTMTSASIIGVESPSLVGSRLVADLPQGIPPSGVANSLANGAASGLAQILHGRLAVPTVIFPHPMHLYVLASSRPARLCTCRQQLTLTTFIMRLELGFCRHFQACVAISL